MKIKVGKEATAPLKGRVFKIQKNLCAVLRAMIMAVAAPLPLKGAHIPG